MDSILTGCDVDFVVDGGFLMKFLNLFLLEFHYEIYLITSIFHGFLSFLQNWKNQSGPENVLRYSHPFLFLLGLPSSVSISFLKIYTVDKDS